MPTFTYFLENEDATRALGEDLALTVKPGDCLALRGDLGAGKSALSRALIRGVAGDDELEVPSPTFTLVQNYEGRVPVAHFDLYRLGSPAELDELGFDEALAEGAALLEWPERAENRLPAATVTVELLHEGDGRRAVLSGSGPAFDRLAPEPRGECLLDVRERRRARDEIRDLLHQRLVLVGACDEVRLAAELDDRRD